MATKILEIIYERANLGDMPPVYSLEKLLYYVDLTAKQIKRAEILSEDVPSSASAMSKAMKKKNKSTFKNMLQVEHAFATGESN